MMVEWEDVVMVDYVTPVPLICPITLAPLVCPHITPCGHIFSFEAIMGHMTTQGGHDLRSSSACPLCATHVAARELRLVNVRKARAVRPGDEITLRLLRRGRHSIIPMPVVPPGTTTGGDASSSSSKGSASGLARSPEKSSAAPWAKRPVHQSSSAGVFSQQNGLNCNPYAKFTTIEDPMPLWIAVAETLAHRATAVIAGGGVEASFELPPLLAAMESLAQRARAWTERRQRMLLEQQIEVAEPLVSPEEAGREAMRQVKAATEAATAAAEAEAAQAAVSKSLEAEFPALSLAGKPQQSAAPQAVNLAPKDAAVSTLQAVKPDEECAESAANSPPEPKPDADDDSHYLYQSEDGQWIFMCQLNMKMLVQWCGSPVALPPVLSARILELENEVQTEGLRKRLRALAHLPLSGSFQQCEVDLTGIMPPEAMAPFASELAQRSKRRMQQAKQEAREAAREAKAVAEAAAAAVGGLSAEELAAMPLPAGSLRPNAPTFSPGGMGTGAPGGGSSPSASGAEGNSSAAQQEPTPAVPIPAGPSFARIAKMGFAATGPALGEGPSPSESSSVGQSPPVGGAWGAWGGSPTPASTLRGGQVSPLVQPDVGGEKTGKKSGKKVLLLSTAQRRY